MTRSLPDVLKCVDKARDLAVDEQHKMENAAGILEHLALEGWGDDNQEQRWLQAGYLARMVKQHCEDLGEALNKIERLTMGAT